MNSNFGLYLALTVPFMLLGFLAQRWVKGSFSKWSQVDSGGPNGAEVARRILSANGLGDVPVCVASSSAPERIRRSLEVTELAGHFGDHVFSASEVVRPKPAPDLFLHAAARMGWSPGECMVVEDSVFGVAAGAAAGMRVIGFTGATHGDDSADVMLLGAGAESVARDAAELAELLGG